MLRRYWKYFPDAEMLRVSAAPNGNHPTTKNIDQRSYTQTLVSAQLPDSLLTPRNPDHEGTTGQAKDAQTG
jgi:hypothetical protein